MISEEKLARLKKSFNAKFKAGPPDECWEWQGYSESGRAKLTLGQNCGVSKWANRIAYFLANGALPRALEVCHTCDNGLCVNPKHLFLGTHQDNMTDMRLKGRAKSLSGIHNKNTRLTREQVLRVRDTSVHYKDLCIAFGIHKNTVFNIRRGSTHATTQEV